MGVVSHIAFALVWTVPLTVFFEQRMNTRSAEIVEWCALEHIKGAESKSDLRRPEDYGTVQAEVPFTDAPEADRNRNTSVRQLGSHFYGYGTTGHGGKCIGFSSTTSFDMSSSSCYGSAICGLCFIGTGLSGEASVEIVKCSTAQFTSTGFLNDEVINGQMGTTHTAEFLFINNDATDMMVIKAASSAGGSAHSTYYLPPQQAVMATCYGGGSNALYFPSDIIEGIGTSVVNVYTFAGKTFSDLGTVATVAVNGGSINGATVGATTQSSGKFTTLQATSTFSVSTGDNQNPSCAGGGGTMTLNSQSGRILSCDNSLASGASETVVLTNSYAQSGSKVTATTQPCTSGKVAVLSATPSNGGVSFVVMNHGSSACSSAYNIMFFIV